VSVSTIERALTEAEKSPMAKGIVPNPRPVSPNRDTK
jgi:hypothetical protein